MHLSAVCLLIKIGTNSRNQNLSCQSLQIMSGLVSFALGIIFAVELQMESSFTTLFRVSHMSGLLVSSTTQS